MMMMMMMMMMMHISAHSFPIRIVILWNRLPAATVLAQNLKQF